MVSMVFCSGPTRWGNQLNGNLCAFALFGYIKQISRPHSLGQSVEWKPECGSKFFKGAVHDQAPLAGAIS